VTASTNAHQRSRAAIAWLITGRGHNVNPGALPVGPALPGTQRRGRRELGGTHVDRVYIDIGPAHRSVTVHKRTALNRPSRCPFAPQNTGMMSSGLMSSPTSTPSMSSSGMAGNAIPQRVTIARTRAMATRQFSAWSS
jgi:hypothetical protein